jgi:membrane-bound inhibitor of C-type lysozyme
MDTSRIAAALLATMLGGCSGGWWPFGRSDAELPNRIPAGATEYACAQGKRLLVRHSADGKSAWVILPDREFRLDRVAAGPGDRFSNGVSTLQVQGEEAVLESEGSRQFADCKRKGTG